ncbi:MAG: hypothetical protein ACTS3F_09250 [Phycisphaerales bacterium]
MSAAALIVAASVQILFMLRKDKARMSGSAHSLRGPRRWGEAG